MDRDSESDECPDCGFALADDMSGTLVRTPRSQEYPCASCLWAHGAPHETEPPCSECGGRGYTYDVNARFWRPCPSCGTGNEATP